MPSLPAQLGRRERSKQEKLDRIIAAATVLFASRGVDEVTTAQIAERADIGTGTLFSYVKSKGELLLLVQNSLYSDALATGRKDAAAATTAAAAVLALVKPIVECNRVHTDNGRKYLQEMVFGDPREPRHAEALAIVADTEDAMAERIRELSPRSAAQAVPLARAVSAVVFLGLAASTNADTSVDDLMSDFRRQLEAILD